jgi:hypothetical protein
MSACFPSQRVQGTNGKRTLACASCVSVDSRGNLWIDGEKFSTSGDQKPKLVIENGAIKLEGSGDSGIPLSSLVSCSAVQSLFTSGSSSANTELLASGCTKVRVSGLAIAPSQLQPGALPGGVTIAPSQLQPGALPGGVTITSNQISGGIPTPGLTLVGDKLTIAGGNTVTLPPSSGGVVSCATIQAAFPAGAPSETMRLMTDGCSTIAVRLLRSAFGTPISYTIAL